MTPLLSIHHLKKHYGGRALFDIDAFVIQQASAYVLTGLNGTGKSTLLRVIAGLERADHGAACYLGSPVRLVPYPDTMRAEIVYVHQHPVMFSGSVAGNIGYGLKARGMPREETDRLVEEAMRWAGVLHLRSSNPATLSGGERQRIALARAKVLNPRLLLLDEPTANLDGRAREQVIELIPQLTRSGSSVIMACHDRDLIAMPGIQRLKLKDGRLQARQNRLWLAPRASA